MSVQLEDTQGVRLAIEGCGHGTLHAIYASITQACKQKGWQAVDLLIIGGDFQAVRNAYDLNCVSMPAKYREMCDFHEYYSGQRTAPYLTIFVGGNHEASNYLFELYYGGWVAPNIYYMGAANVLRFGPLRIAALSGIWKGYNYRKEHYERLPYNETDIKSIYHVRERDVRKLLQIRTQVDIGISHDWPKGVEWKGNWKQLFRFKPHFEDDARSGQLGSVAAKQVMDWLRPKWWFSAHLHCKFAALVNHDEPEASQQPLPKPQVASRATRNDDEIDLDEQVDGPATAAVEARNEAEINLDLDGESELKDDQDRAGITLPANADDVDLELEDDQDGVAPGAPGQGLNGVHVPVATDRQTTKPSEESLDTARAALPESFRRPAAPAPVEHPPEISNKLTEFLALDKCLPKRHFLQLLAAPSDPDVETSRPFKLEYDREWLAITRSFALDEHLQLGDPDATMPKLKAQADYADAIEKRRSWIDENISQSHLVVPETFEITAPVYDGGNWNLPQYSQVTEYPNPQTARYCEILQIPNPFDISEDDKRQRMAAGPRPDPDANSFSGGRGRGGFRGGRGNFRGGRGRGRARGGGRGRSRGR